MDLEPGSQPGFIPSHRNIQTVLQQPGALQNRGFGTRPNRRPPAAKSRTEKGVPPDGLHFCQQNPRPG